MEFGKTGKGVQTGCDFTLALGRYASKAIAILTALTPEAEAFFDRDPLGVVLCPITGPDRTWSVTIEDEDAIEAVIETMVRDLGFVVCYNGRPLVAR